MGSTLGSESAQNADALRGETDVAHARHAGVDDGFRGGDSRGVAAFGRSSAQMAPEEGTGVTFDDVAGVDEAAEELQEVIAFLTTPEKFTSLGGRPPKGVLLVGPKAALRTRWRNARSAAPICSPRLRQKQKRAPKRPYIFSMKYSQY